MRIKKHLGNGESQKKSGPKIPLPGPRERAPLPLSKFWGQNNQNSLISFAWNLKNGLGNPKGDPQLQKHTFWLLLREAKGGDTFTICKWEALLLPLYYWKNKGRGKEECSQHQKPESRASTFSFVFNICFNRSLAAIFL